MLAIAVIEHRQSLGRAAAVVQELSPGYFAFVMATSIISTGTLALGPSWLSRVLLVIAATGFVEGFSCALWAFGTWWMFGKVARLTFMEPLGRFMLWVALAAWLAVAAALAARIVAGRRPPKVSLR